MLGLFLRPDAMMRIAAFRRPDRAPRWTLPPAFP